MSKPTMSKSTEENRAEETTRPNAERLPLFARRTQKLGVRTGVKAGNKSGSEGE